MLIVTGWREEAFLLTTVKRILYLGCVLLRYVLIDNLEVSFNFHLTFLQLNGIKIFTVQEQLFFTLCTYQCNAGGGGGGGGGRTWGGDLTFFKNLQSNSLPTGKSFQSNATKFPHPRLHIAVNPKAEPKKGTIKISPNKTLQSFINVAASPKIHVPVTAAIVRFNHNPCYTA